MDHRNISSALKAACAMLGALSAAACTTTRTADTPTNAQYRDAVGVYSSTAPDQGLDPIAAAGFWGTRYNADQSDPAVAVKFSQALRKIKSTDEAVKVMQRANMMTPGDADVSLEYGKVLVETGRAFEAVRHLENAIAKKPGDWNALSAYGVALDQIGEHAAARKQYDRALGHAPGAVSIINNKGLSFALEGDLKSARLTLRQAAARAGGDARIRQNLALVLALSGDLRSAERLARSDLPPVVADQNIDFYRQLMNQPAYWSEYTVDDNNTPDFDQAPAAPLQGIPLPDLREEPKQEEKEREDAKKSPMALIGVDPVTRASAEKKPE